MTFPLDRVGPAGARDAILGTWRRSFPHLPDARFEWIYVRNPAGRALIWIARTDDGAVTGAAALLPRAFTCEGRAVVGAISADFAVDPDYRGFGPALALQRAAAAAADAGEVEFVYGLPNAQALPLLRRARFRQIGTAQQRTRIVSARTYLARRFGAAGRALAPIADLTLAMSRIPAALRVRRSGLRGEVLDSVDERFDRLWEEVRSNRALVGDRHSDFLRWRFGSSPQATHSIFGLTDPTDDRLVGYIVYHAVADRTIIDDLLVADVGPTLDTLLQSFVRQQRRAGASAVAVTVFGASELLRGFDRNGFALRDASQPVVAYVRRDSPVASYVADPENWWLFSADNDV